jgi:hypothetical protein
MVPLNLRDETRVLLIKMNAGTMIEVEISSIFHELLLIISYLAGAVFSIHIGRKNNIHPVVTALLVLIATIFYLLFFNYFVSHSGNWFPELQSGFPHIDKSFGMAGIFFGMMIAGILLRIPHTILYKFSYPVLIVYGISNLGCLGGHCLEVHTGLFHLQDYQNFLGSFRIGTFLKTGLLADPSLLPILFKITAGFVALAVLYPFLDKFRNPRNLFIMVFASILLISYINQFFFIPDKNHPVFHRLLGMNIFQWAILMVTSLALIHVIIEESTRRYRNPRLRVKSPSYYKVLFLYVLVLFIAFHDSTYIAKTNPSIFIIGFSFTTIVMVLYFYERIRLSAIRYATILIILAAGFLFLQTRFFNPENDIPEFSNAIYEMVSGKREALGKDRITAKLPSEKKRYQFFESHQLGHESLTLSPIHSVADRVLGKYTDHSLEIPAIEDLEQ